MGELFALLASMSFALAGVFAQRGTKNGSSDNGTFISLLQTFFICGLIVSYFIYKFGSIHITFTGVCWFILGGFLSTFLGRFYLYASVQHLGSVRSTAVKNLTPVFSVLLGVLLLGEVLTLQFCFGLLFILSGLFMMVRQSLNENKERETPNDSNESVPETSGSKTKKIVKKMQSLLNIGYLFGAVSAFSYTLGLVVRKKGLNDIPEPFLGAAFGAAVGGIVGILVYIVLAYFKDSYKTAIKATFTRFNGFLLFSGFVITTGQILNFLAVSYIDVSRVGLLFSTQSIFAIIISKWFVKTYENITLYTLLTIGVMITGTVIIILE